MHTIDLQAVDENDSLTWQFHAIPAFTLDAGLAESADIVQFTLAHILPAHLTLALQEASDTLDVGVRHVLPVRIDITTHEAPDHTAINLRHVWPVRMEWDQQEAPDQIAAELRFVHPVSMGFALHEQRDSAALGLRFVHPVGLDFSLQEASDTAQVALFHTPYNRVRIAAPPPLSAATLHLQRIFQPQVKERRPVLDWLRDRLTPYKQKEMRWHDLAMALEAYWDSYSLPALERLENLKSVFTSEDTDIEKLLRELGIKFEVALPIFPDNLPFAYSWRLYEIHRKDRADTLAQILRRDFPSVEVRWVPLFARRDVPYGEEFMSAEEAVFYPDDYVYRTYRGFVLVNQDDLRRTQVDPIAFQDTCKRKMEILRPAHIVYDDVTFFLAFGTRFCPPHIEKGCSETLIRPHHLTFSLIGRYDEVPADMQDTDREPISSAYCPNP